MDLMEAEEDGLLRDSARRFLAEHHGFNQRRGMIEASDRGGEPLWSAFADMGWLSLPIAEDHGGLGGSLHAVCALHEAFGASLVVAPYLSSIMLGAGLVAQFGSAAQQRAILPEVAQGRLKLALAHGEAGRDFDAKPATHALRLGGRWQLRGHKQEVLDAASADHLLVSAVLEVPGRPAQTAVFMVSPTAPGLRRDDYLTIDERSASDLQIDDVVVDDAARLGDFSSDAMPAIQSVLLTAIVAQSADALGIADTLAQSTFDYARTRQQFGKPLASFQALQHRMAEMAVLREEIRSCVLLGVLSNALPAETRQRRIASIKAKIGRSLRYIAQQAVQIHGAMGVTEELPIGAYLKRATAYELRFGHGDTHQRRYVQLCSTESLRDSLLVI